MSFLLAALLGAVMLVVAPTAASAAGKVPCTNTISGDTTQAARPYCAPPARPVCVKIIVVQLNKEKCATYDAYLKLRNQAISESTRRQVVAAIFGAGAPVAKAHIPKDQVGLLANYSVGYGQLSVAMTNTTVRIIDTVYAQQKGVAKFVDAVALINKGLSKVPYGAWPSRILSAASYAAKALGTLSGAVTYNNMAYYLRMVTETWSVSGSEL